MNHNISRLNSNIIKCKLCPRLIKFRDKIVKNKRKQFINETYWLLYRKTHKIAI